MIDDNLSTLLTNIWNMGDRDECSEKHVGYGLIAIACDRSWEDAIDYRRPWDTSASNVSAWGSISRLDALWKQVADLRKIVGHDEWDRAVRESRFSWYYESRMEDAVLRYAGFAE